jgi:glyoxylate utilization-related uncharacterized protein
VTRFAEVTLDARGSCQTAIFDREEEIYFVLDGKGVLHYGDQTFALRSNDFTYLPPGIKHSISNSSEQPVRILLMSFKIPAKTAIGTPSPQPRIVNMEDVKEETVAGHPTSVLYKLLIGPRTGKRDAIDEAYVVTKMLKRFTWSSRAKARWQLEAAQMA